MYKKIRLESLLSDPNSFDSSYEHDYGQSDIYWRTKLKENNIFALFDKDQIIGCCGFYIMSGERFCHRGVIWGVYISTRYRGKALASRMIDEVINFASGKVVQIHLSCMQENISALSLYIRKGFRIYGIEPRTVKIGDHYFSDFLLAYNFIT